MTASLEQQLADLCEMHGLKSIEIAYSVGGEKPRVDVYVRRGGATQSDRIFGDNIAAAFKDALSRLNATVPVELSAFGVAA